MKRIYDKSLRQSSSRLEIAPLIDIVFTLLIFFAIATTLAVSNKGLDLILPSAETVVEQKNNTVLIVNEKQEIYLNGELMSLSNLSTKINDLIKNDPNMIVNFNADKRIPYSLVISVLDTLRLAGCYNIVLEAEKKSTEDDEFNFDVKKNFKTKISANVSTI